MPPRLTKPTTIHRSALEQAIGRSPEATELGLEAAGVQMVGRKGYIQADDQQNTSVPGVYALGDVCGKVRVI